MKLPWSHEHGSLRDGRSSVTLARKGKSNSLWAQALRRGLAIPESAADKDSTRTITTGGKCDMLALEAKSHRFNWHCKVVALRPTGSAHLPSHEIVSAVAGVPVAHKEFPSSGPGGFVLLVLNRRTMSIRTTVIG